MESGNVACGTAITEMEIFCPQHTKGPGIFQFNSVCPWFTGWSRRGNDESIHELLKLLVCAPATRKTLSYISERKH